MGYISIIILFITVFLFVPVFLEVYFISKKEKLSTDITAKKTNLRIRDVAMKSNLQLARLMSKSRQKTKISDKTASYNRITAF